MLAYFLNLFLKINVTSLNALNVSFEYSTVKTIMVDVSNIYNFATRRELKTISLDK